MVKMPKKVIFLLIVFVAVGLLLLFSAMTANRTARKAISAPTFILYPVEKQPQSFDFSKTQSANFPKVLPAYKVEKKGLTGSEAASILQFFNITSRPRFINNNSPDGPQYSWEEKEIKYKKKKKKKKTTHQTKKKKKKKKKTPFFPPPRSRWQASQPRTLPP